MNSTDRLKLNNIKNRLSRHQPIAPDDLHWLIDKLEQTDFELEQVNDKYKRLKDAINKSQTIAIDANERVHRVYGEY